MGPPGKQMKEEQMAVSKVEREIGGRVLTLETGKVARQSHGAVWVRYGDTVVLATVLTAPPQRDIDFFPLYVDYREYQYAAGKVPGGWFKREGRPSSKEILTCRLIDRPIRPLFPDDFVDEVQIQCMVLSSDTQNDPDILALIGSSAALALSPAPFLGPIGAARIGCVDGNLVVSPTHDELALSDMDLVVCGPKESVNMIELGGKEVPEDVVIRAIAKGHETCRVVVEMIEELVAKARVTKSYVPKPLPAELLKTAWDKCAEKIRQA